MSMFWQAAPAERTCSHSGILWFSITLEITAMTSGARLNRSASASTCSGVALGLFAEKTLAST